jgi:histidyl-tRNA synthetase
MNKNTKKTKSYNVPVKEKKIKTAKESPFVNFLPINKAVESAIYYGFTPIKAPIPNKDDIKKALSLKEAWARNGTKTSWVFSKDFSDERAAVLREYYEKGMNSLPQPIMLVYESDSKTERNKNSFNLEILGNAKSITEALLIKTATAILSENGYKNILIEVNSIGDKESSNKFCRDLTNSYKKNLNNVCAKCRQNFKRDPFYVLGCEAEDCQKIKEGAPTSISCLSDSSREHFKEVLEYIEIMGIPYKINSCLVSDKRYCSQTIFEIKNADNDKETLAIGFRYDGLSHKLGNKKDVPGMGMKIFTKKKGAEKMISKLAKPIAFFIQLGDDAKHKSLEVLESLRKEGVYIYHMLGRDKFGSQFSLVEKSKVPYVIIMGKKESLENSVMIRENLTRNQETIQIPEIPKYLKKIKR